MEKERIVYFDFLRIFAALSVVLAHIVYFHNPIGTDDYSVYLYKDITGYCIPVFVMISGALFLDPIKNITINKILKKYIPRIMIIFFSWSFLYACLDCIHDHSIYYFIKYLIKGYPHQWFLYMIATLYLITPLLRPITEKKDKNLLLYLLIIWFIMTSVISFIKFIVPSTQNFFDIIINHKMFFSFPISFLGCFVLGYYLHNYININNNLILIATIILSSLIIFIYKVTFKTSAPFLTAVIVQTLSPFMVILAISIFLLAKNKFSKCNEHVSKILFNLSNLTLGVYMIHPFFILVAKKLNLFNIPYLNSIDNYLFIAPIVLVVVSIFSFGSVYLLSKVPFIKKYCL